MGAFFGGTVVPGYRDALRSGLHQDLLDRRQRLTVAQYENFYCHALPSDGSDYQTPRHTHGPYRLAGVEGHKRMYEEVAAAHGVGHASRPQAAAPMP
jgi:hydroxymethylglutaryl-CoA synthase